MKKTISCIVSLLILAILVLGQAALGSTQGAAGGLPASAGQDASSGTRGNAASIADSLTNAYPPVGDKALLSGEAWHGGTGQEGSGATTVAGPEQDTLYSIADACLIEGYPTRNMGSASDMWAGYDDYLEPDGRIVRGLVKFDISSLPSGKTVKAATLRLYLVDSWDYPNSSRLTKTHRVTSGWSESSVAWSSAPGYGESRGQRLIPHTHDVWQEFDVTDLVQGWYDGTYANHGIMIRGEEAAGSDSGWRSFSTKEGSYRPQLAIVMDDANMAFLPLLCRNCGDEP